MKLLITGASGLYGSKLAQLAVAKDYEVYSTDVQELQVWGNFVKMDISNKMLLTKRSSELSLTLLSMPQH